MTGVRHEVTLDKIKKAAVGIRQGLVALDAIVVSVQ